jgi:hypothetical protein
VELDKKTAFWEAGSNQARGYFTLSYASQLNTSKTYVVSVYTPVKTCQIIIYFMWGKTVDNKNSQQKSPQGAFLKTNVLFL